MYPRSQITPPERMEGEVEYFLRYWFGPRSYTAYERYAGRWFVLQENARILSERGLNSGS